MNVKLRGIHRVNKKLAGGSIRTYYYAWRGGPRIAAQFGTPEFVAEYLLHKGNDKQKKPEAKPDTLNYLIDQYVGSLAFSTLAEATQREYLRYIHQIGEKFGDAPLDVITEPSAAREYRRWHHSMERTPRAADYALSVLKRLLSWGVDSGNILHNPAASIRQHKIDGDRSDIIWTADQIDALKEVAPAHVWQPFQMALLTSQRKKDILEMQWSAYDGESIRIIQSKGKKRVWIKASQELRDVLDGLPRTSQTIFLNSRARPWTLSGYDSSWKSAVKASGVSGVTFHDSRGTAITLAYIGGSSLREIALMSGHTEEELERFLNRHYLNRDAAAAAINAIVRARGVNHEEFL